MQDGQRRFGNPKSNKERAKRHKRLYGTTKLPPRGTGLKKKTTVRFSPPQKIDSDNIYAHIQRM